VVDGSRVVAMKKGINHWAFGDMSVRDSMALAKRAGFQSIELNMGEEGEIIPASGKSDIEEIAITSGYTSTRVMFLRRVFRTSG
jgi:hypothetical protein